MKSIEIRTAHNIVLRYDLAPIGDRIIAFVIDLAIVGVYSFFVSLAISFGSFNEVLGFVLITPALLLYHLSFEIFNNGQSPGKMAVKIRVIHLSGESVSIKNSIIRWSLRSVDIMISIGAMAIISILGSNRNQRIGDLLAESSVIKVSRKETVSIKSLEKLNAVVHEVRYPEVQSLFTEDDMLMIKDSLQRYHDTKSEASKKVIKYLLIRSKDLLGIQNPEEGNMEFLKNLLRDYVYLTR